MINSSDKEILEKANNWIKTNHKVILATVVQTWGSSPQPVGSRMVVNEKGDFSGSVSGGCIESTIIRECLEMLRYKKPNKKYTVLKIRNIGNNGKIIKGPDSKRELYHNFNSLEN